MGPPRGDHRAELVRASMMRFVILGQPCSKANSRQLVHFGERIVPIKSKEALAYEKAALRQIPPAARQRIAGPVRISITIYYASERPDLDPSVILDCLQDRYVKDKKTGERVLVQKGVVQNDRQFREMHFFHAIDRRNPRAEIEIEPLVPQQQALEVEPATVEEGPPF
jgi:Holliday junction resolvase RusA-like endonuclease